MKTLLTKSSSLNQIVNYPADEEIGLAALTHPHTTSPVFREWSVSGETVYSIETSENHGLSRIAISIGGTSDEPCFHLEPQPAALTYTLDGKAVVLPEAWEAYKQLEFSRPEIAATLFKKVALPTFSELGTRLIQLSEPELTDEDAQRIAREIPRGSLNRIPHQGRGRLILDSELYQGDSEFLDLEDDDLQYHADKAKSDGDTELYDRLLDEIAVRENRISFCGQFNATAEEVAPVEPENWGLPHEWYEAMKNGKSAFNELLAFTRSAPGEDLTCGSLADLYYHETGETSPALFSRSGLYITYEIARQVMLETSEAHAEAVAEFHERKDAAGFWMNLGSIVDGVVESNPGVRPRASIGGAPPSEPVGNKAEEESIARDILRSSSPSDKIIYRGSTAPFADILPYTITPAGFSGHPCAFLLDRAIQASQNPYQDSSQYLIERLILSPCHFIEGEYVEVSTYDPDTQETGKQKCPAVALGDSDEPILGWILGGDPRVGYVVQYKNPNPPSGYSHRLTEYDMDIIEALNDNMEMCLELSGKSSVNVGSKLSFSSYLKYLLVKAQLMMLPTLNIEDGYAVVSSSEPLSASITYVPLSEIYPMVLGFLAWLCDNYEGGVVGRDEEAEGWLDDIQAELSAYQNRMMRALAEMNANYFFGNEIDNMKSELSSGDNVGFDTWAELNMALWGRLSAIDPIIPLPMTKNARGEWVVGIKQMWKTMGYLLPTTTFLKDTDYLGRMVKSFILSTHPMDDSSNFVNEKIGMVSLSKKVYRPKISWTKTGAWNVGVVGELLRLIWAKRRGPTLPCFPNSILTLNSLRDIFPAVHSEFEWNFQRLKETFGLQKSERQSDSTQQFLTKLLTVEPSYEVSMKTSDEGNKSTTLRSQCRGHGIPNQMDYRILGLILNSNNPGLTLKLLELALRLKGHPNKKTVFNSVLKAALPVLGENIISEIQNLA